MENNIEQYAYTDDITVALGQSQSTSLFNALATLLVSTENTENIRSRLLM